jgi:fatty-acid desaturase
MLKWLAIYRLYIEDFIHIFNHIAVISLIIYGDLIYWIIGIFWFYLIMIIGTEIGSHRLFAHESFSASNVSRRVLGFFSAICVYGSPVDWRVSHLLHHRFADTSDDPTSPDHQPMLNIIFGLWRHRARKRALSSRHATALALKMMKNPLYRSMTVYYIPTVLIWGVLLFLIDPLLGAAMFSLPALLVFYVLNTLSILNHRYGHRPIESTNKSTDLWAANLIAPGAGWHRYHHDHPADYRFGHNGRIDPAAWVIERVFLSPKPCKSR